MALTERQRKILNAVTERYIGTGSPVSSKEMVGLAGVLVSSSTVRNEFVLLEEKGYLTHPHTSAGRVPTDLGYRAYLNRLIRSGELNQSPHPRVGSIPPEIAADPEAVLRHASHLLAEAMHCPAVVVAPTSETPSLQHVQASRVGPRTVLLAYVTSDGAVHHRLLPIKEAVSPEQLTRLSEGLNRLLRGVKVSSLSRFEMDEIRRRTPGGAVPREVLRLILEAARAEEDQQVYVEGAIYMLEAPEFAAVDRLRPVMGALEQHNMLIQALQAHEPPEPVWDRPQPVWVRIGREQLLAQLHDCTIVATTYRTAQGLTGTLGIIGPTRLNYVAALPAVRVIAAELAAALSRHP